MIRCLLIPFAVLGLIGPVAAQDEASEPQSTAADSVDKRLASGDVVSLFNGKDLDGWRGRDDLWSVEDGAIVGRTSDDDPIQGNTFLIWSGGQPSDFELVAEFKIESGNSGIQYRSKVVDEDKFVVGGYQGDVDFGNHYAGIVYEEKGRGILVGRGEKATIGPDGKKVVQQFADTQQLAKGIHPGKWNEFRIVAKGNHLTQYINGAKVSEVIDQQSEKAAKSGVIALQLHQGPAMVVRFKNLSLRPVQ